MRVSVIGAGIGGLCVAIALKKNGHEVVVYERVSEMKPVGAALTLWANGIKCLNYLGMRNEIVQIGGQLNNLAYVNGLDGSTLTEFSLHPLHTLVGQRSYPVSRAQLQEALIDALGTESVHFGKCLTDVMEENDKVIAIFEDGTKAESDLLVGADGAHSTVRSFVLGRKIERTYAGYVNWNGLTSMRNPSKDSQFLAPVDQWTTYVGEGKRASLMPVSDGRFYFFFDVPIPKGSQNEKNNYKQDLHEHFNGWIQPVHDIIESIDPNSTNRIEIHDMDPLMNWSKGRVTLIGDAAHNSTPDIGQGGGMAIEDAIVLSWCIEAHDNDLEESLQRFSNMRAERCRELVLRARKRSNVTHGIDVEANRFWYKELSSESGQNITGGISKTILGGPFS